MTLMDAGAISSTYGSIPRESATFRDVELEPGINIRTDRDDVHAFSVSKKGGRYSVKPLTRWLADYEFAGRLETNLNFFGDSFGFCKSVENTVNSKRSPFYKEDHVCIIID